MKLIHGLPDQHAAVAPSVLTIGNFDGVHRGHRRIIAAARASARADNLPVVALTFEPHPLSILRPDRAPDRLSLPEHKYTALADAGVDVTVVLDSTAGILGVPAEAFILDEIVPRLRPRCIVEGENFGFGKDRSGDVATLQRLAPAGGYATRVVEPVRMRLPDGSEQRISSSLVRRLLLDGAVAAARDALGRAYTLTGTVQGGAGRGRTLGFPTANVVATHTLIPVDGVYAGVAEWGAMTRTAAISIGPTPTFDGATRQVEAHLLDFTGDLYDQTVELHFHEFLRGQRRFASKDELVAQITADVARTRELIP